MEKEFEDFFLHCQKLTNYNQNEMKKILKPLRFHLCKLLLMKVFKIVLVVGSICCAIYYIDTLNWIFCAIGRIAMIKLLPLWNWTYLANEKCLISKTISLTNSNDEVRSLNEKDCRACEHFGEGNFFALTKIILIFFNRSSRCFTADNLQFHSRQILDSRFTCHHQ